MHIGAHDAPIRKALAFGTEFLALGDPLVVSLADIRVTAWPILRATTATCSMCDPRDQISR